MIALAAMAVDLRDVLGRRGLYRMSIIQHDQTRQRSVISSLDVLIRRLMAI